MFCLLCRRHSTSDNQNKSKYNLEPAIRFKWKAFEEHANSQQHAAAITAKLLSRVSTFEEVRKIEDAKDDVYYKTLLTMKWISKEEISNKKFTSLLELLQQVSLEDIKYFKHRSAGSVREMFLLIGSILKAQLVHDISKAKCFDFSQMKFLMCLTKSSLSQQWLTKPRQHLAKIPARDKLPVQVTTTADASVQVDTERLDVMRAWEAAAALVKNTDNIIDQEVEQAVAYLKLPPIDATSEAEESSKSQRQR